jgi:4-diphosphocytidyl-2-C-methyl-D-erythritol kinase
VEKKQAEICTIEAPCKLNLHLSVGEKRPDGFHSLEGLFISLDFPDTLRFELSETEGESLLSINYLTPCEEIQEKNNLVLRAISLFRERTGFKTGLKIRLDKRIPVGAGLGGGSSDAASTLLALNLLAGMVVSEPELGEMAAILGSYVPFFLTGGAAIVSGRGELVTPVKFPGDLCVVLVKPPFSSDTALAYRLLDRVREGAGREGTEGLFKARLSREALIRNLEGKSENWPFYNDFYSVFLNSAENSGIYKSILNSLQGFGASFTGLSGTGSCCFGIFPSPVDAKRAMEKLDKLGNFVRLTFFVAHRPIPVLK